MQARAELTILTQHHSRARTLAASRMMMCQQADILGKQVLRLSTAVHSLGVTACQVSNPVPFTSSKGACLLSSGCAFRRGSCKAQM